MSDLIPVNMNGFVLSPGDVLELLPDINQDEMEEVANIVTDYLMEEWARCLEDAVSVIKADRRTDEANR